MTMAIPLTERLSETRTDQTWPDDPCPIGLTQSNG
jgi:hypothetical protein